MTYETNFTTSCCASKNKFHSLWKPVVASINYMAYRMLDIIAFKAVPGSVSLHDWKSTSTKHSPERQVACCGLLEVARKQDTVKGLC